MTKNKKNLQIGSSSQKFPTVVPTVVPTVFLARKFTTVFFRRWFSDAYSAEDSASYRFACRLSLFAFRLSLFACLRTDMKSVEEKIGALERKIDALKREVDLLKIERFATPAFDDFATPSPTPAMIRPPSKPASSIIPNDDESFSNVLPDPCPTPFPLRKSQFAH